MTWSHKKIDSHLEGLSNIKPFINNYNWEGTNYPSEIEDWKIFGKNNIIRKLYKDYMNKFFKSLREHAKNVNEKMLWLTKKELKSHQDAPECYTC